MSGLLGPPGMSAWYVWFAWPVWSILSARLLACLVCPVPAVSLVFGLSGLFEQLPVPDEIHCAYGKQSQQQYRAECIE
jgi:hypothetical protein